MMKWTFISLSIVVSISVGISWDAKTRDGGLPADQRNSRMYTRLTEGVKVKEL